MCDYVSSSSAASSSRSWKYDVFLSFRGEDTRKNFVSHLYDALQKKGIRVFKDDEQLEVGKLISNELRKAIQESSFAIVIFSKKYASSIWCLEELAHIIKCKKELDLDVIPIFYDVNPTDVRNQKSPFDDSFSKHEKSCKDDMEKVQRWRDAFVEAGNCSGYHLQNLKDEAECIKKVVDHIFPNVLQVSSPFPEGLVGVAQVENVISLLNPKSDDVRFFGLHGMGGIGKTEIANAIYEKYLPDFDAGCFLEDVGEKCLTERLLRLQQALIRELLGEKKRFTSVHQGARFIQQRLRIKKALLVLDGVSHQEQLECLAGDPKWFGKGSKIIVTARDKQLLISHGANVYEVQLLTEEESLELFSWHAFKEKSPKEELMELSRQVVQYAGRLPLALKVLGPCFYGRDKEQWRGIIDRLMKIPQNNILAKLRISFDGLEKDVKEMFLDMACLYNKSSKNYVELVLQSRGIKWIVIDYLVDKSLLSIHRDVDRFEMHNLIRDMGENILREEYSNSRIWLNEEVHALFAGNLETEKVESLRIQESYEFEDDHIKISKVFKRMKSLKVLRIDYGTFSTNCTVTHLPSSLRFVDWSGYKSSSLPENFKPSQLVVLCLQDSELVELWPVPKMLKHLDLSWSIQLTKTPNFAEMPNLETLILRGCKILEEVHPSLGHCRMLKELSLGGCTKLEKLPDFVSMLVLKSLDLSSCESLKKFSKISGPMQSLSELSVESPRIRTLPPSLSGLTELRLIKCEALESIPDTITQNLKSLCISGCNKLTTLPRSLEVHNNLVHLSINKCESLKKLPNSIQMESLEHLEICNCPKLATFPEINGEMQRLLRLVLQSNGIKELPSSIGNLSGLTYLNLQGCEDLVSLPNNLCNLKNLQCLWLCRCKKLEKLPENIGDLQLLKVLTASETAMSQPVPPSFTKLCKLQFLQFSTFVLHQVSSLSSLTHLHLTNCNILGGLLEDLVCLSSLESLELCNSNIKGGLPEDIGSLHSLRNLNLSGSNISYLPKIINKLLRLTSLNVQFCKSLSELPGELPPNLEELYADDHLALKRIRDLLVKCIKLKVISFSVSTECKPAPTNQNLLKFLGHFLRTLIQCHFQQRAYFHISFPIGGRIPESSSCRFSCNLNPSWYTNHFKGFLICFRGTERLEYDKHHGLTILLSDQGKHAYKRRIPEVFPRTPSFLSIIYIPFYSFWLDCLLSKVSNPNNYCLFEVCTSRFATFWRIYVEYENNRFEQLEPSHASSHLQTYDELNFATDMGLHLGYEIDHAKMAAPKEHETQNVELTRVCDGPSRKMGDASRKRKRKRSKKRKKIIKVGLENV